MRIIHWLLMWPCLWIGILYKRPNWWSEQTAKHWLKSRKFFYDEVTNTRMKLR